MGKQIDVARTVENILAVDNVQFKILKRDDKTNSVFLVTQPNDDFQRGTITVSPESVSVGIQGPDKDGKIVTSLQPVAVEVLETIAFKDEDVPIIP